jgi:hypothetical protein
VASPVSCSASSTGPPVNLGVEVRPRGAGAADVQAGLSGEVFELRRAAAEGARVDCAHDGEGGVARPDGIGDACDRRVVAEEDDAPAARAQREPEGEEPQVVLLAGRAGEDRHRSHALAPAAGEPEQAATQQRRGVVLLGDRHGSPLPLLAELVQVRHDDVAEERVDRQPCEQRVERRVRGGVVEAQKGVGELVLRGRH